MFTSRHTTDLARGTLLFHDVGRGSQSSLQRQHYRWDVVGNQVIAVHDITTAEADDTKLAFQTRYLHRDHLGSVSLITDNDGQIIERLNYDPWGQRRDIEALASLASTAASQLAANDSDTNANTGDENKDNTLATTGAGIDLSQTLIATVFQPKWTTFHRGYTGHEMLDHLNLIHMNGRIYDPEIGRFLSADPFVQFPESTQGFNRYTYVGNNPLSYTDPSGFFSWKKALGKIAGIAGAVIGAAVCVGSVGIGCAVAAGAITGAVGGYLATGTLEGALMGAALGAASAAVAFKIGGAYETGKINLFEKSVLHGITQGALSKAGGGRFGDGFLGGFSGSLSSAIPLSSNPVIKVMQSATIGGTLAKIGGGNFANGAISAAFVTAFNDLQHGDPIMDEVSYEEWNESETSLSIENPIGAGKVSVDANWDGDGEFSASITGSTQVGPLEMSLSTDLMTFETSDEFYLEVLNSGPLSAGPYVKNYIMNNADYSVGIKSGGCIAIVCVSSQIGLKPNQIMQNFNTASQMNFYRDESRIYGNIRILEDLFGD